MTGQYLLHCEEKAVSARTVVRMPDSNKGSADRVEAIRCLPWQAASKRAQELPTATLPFCRNPAVWQLDLTTLAADRGCEGGRAGKAKTHLHALEREVTHVHLKDVPRYGRLKEETVQKVPLVPQL